MRTEHRQALISGRGAVIHNIRALSQLFHLMEIVAIGLIEFAFFGHIIKVAADEVIDTFDGVAFRNEMIGQTGMLDKSHAISHWKANGLDFTKLFHKTNVADDVPIYHTERQDHGLDKVLDNKLIELAGPAIENKTPVRHELDIKNTDRTAGTMLSGTIAKKYGHAGLPEDTIWFTFKGTAGQSFGAWVTHGVTMDLVGEGNDYVGKGLSGGKIIVRPDPKSSIVPEESIIVGNTLLYGAIEGECYFRGVAGERFAVRNSGAYAVVEGTGDHCCEYMTGGVVVVLGQTGRNFAAGMSGGLAYVLDEDGTFETRCNMAMVQFEPIAADPAVADKLKANGGMESSVLADAMRDMLGQDAERLHALIVRHAHYTNSKRAQEILADWDAYLPRFKKIMPIEYRRALTELAKAQSSQAPSPTAQA